MFRWILLWFGAQAATIAVVRALGLDPAGTRWTIAAFLAIAALALGTIVWRRWRAGTLAATAWLLVPLALAPPGALEAAWLARGLERPFWLLQLKLGLVACAVVAMLYLRRRAPHVQGAR